jgi:hypothetical protein
MYLRYVVEPLVYRHEPEWICHADRVAWEEVKKEFRSKSAEKRVDV